MAFYKANDNEWYYIDLNGIRHRVNIRNDWGHWAAASYASPPVFSGEQEPQAKKLAEYDAIDQQDDEEKDAR